MKAIVILDKMPENCRMCQFRHSPWSFCLGEYGKENHCPLRPIPDKAAEDLLKGLDAIEKMKSVEVRTVRRTE